MAYDFSTLSLDVLLGEPARLEQSISLLRDQFDASMASNYDYFIKTVGSAATITDELDTCGAQVRQLSADLQTAVALSRDAAAGSAAVLSALSGTAAAFRSLPQLQDVLQVPAMMRTCRISGFHDEALRLHQCVARFARQYPGIPALERTLSEADRLRSDVLSVLLSSFSGKLKLADAIQNMNLLKSSEAYSDGELKVGFVRGRFGYLHEKLRGIALRSAVVDFDCVTKRYRSAFNKITTQYRALFSDEDAVLHAALNSEIQRYLSFLADALERVSDVSDARQVMQSALYFASSLGRVGMSFVPLVDNAFFNSKWAKSSVS